jgi:hypothetical protein
MEEAAMMTVTMASGHRYGMNSRPMRRSDTSRACARSAAVTVRGPRPRLVLVSRFVSVVAKKFSILPTGKKSDAEVTSL